ncbi:HEPN family nuclease [Pantoea allii]|uniref:HEPN family nuclease n=1 Tax=Pantoea allii TaxID=574096 RepID=UPI003D32263F
MEQSNNTMSLKEIFDADNLNPKLEALDLLTSYSCTMQFLEHFYLAIFNKGKQSSPVIDVYIEYLHSLGLINTIDDLPEILTGRENNPNELQAVRNLKFPNGLGSIAAYLSLNLGIAKEIVADKIPNKNSTKVKSEWFLDEFSMLLDESNPNPTVYRVITRLRNAISHHNFKLRIPDSKIHEIERKDKIEITFYDTDGKAGNDFLAKATFSTIEKIIKKIHSAEYTFHSCPEFEYDELNSETIVEYVKNCFIHFTRTFTSKGLKFQAITRLGPKEAYELEASTGFFEISQSEVLPYKVCFSLNNKPCKEQYIRIPYFNNNWPITLKIADEVHSLGEYPIQWLLNDYRSPLCRLDKQIREIINIAINSR